MIDGLISILQAEYELVEKLNELSEMKTNALIAEDINTINELSKHEEHMERKLNVLESRRVDAINEITVFNKAFQTMRLSEIIEKTEEPLRGRLLTLKGDIENAYKKIGRNNYINKELICTNLNYIEYMINLIFADKQAVTYGVSGNTTPSIPESIFDNKA